MERLEEMRRKAYLTRDEGLFLIDEVGRLRAKLAEWKGNYQVLLDGTSDYARQLIAALVAERGCQECWKGSSCGADCHMYVETVMMGLLRNMNTEQFYVDDSEVDAARKARQEGR